MHEMQQVGLDRRRLVSLHQLRVLLNTQTSRVYSSQRLLDFSLFMLVSVKGTRASALFNQSPVG